MRVLQYNILDGCNSDKRFLKLDNWIQQNEHYDIIGFNEMNGWTSESLKIQAKKWGFEYSYLLTPKTSPYYIGVISKLPIKLINTYEEEFHHGLIHVEIKNIQYFLTHLKPFGSIQREEETKFIAKLTRSLNKPAIIMGDLNTLSPLDKNHYNQMGVLESFLSDKKFNAELHNNKINYNPLQILLDAGFYDIGYSDYFQYTIPTVLGGSPIKRRIDYFLVNEKVKQLNPQTLIINSNEVEEVSDHYPVECYWED